jgi:predicted PurR-regulated permease PerM
MVDEAPRSNTWTPRMKRTVLLITLGLTGLLLWQARDVLPLIIVGILLAFLLTPLVDWYQNRLLSWLPFGRRAIAILLTLITVIVIIGLLLLLLVPSLINQFEELQTVIPTILEDIQRQIDRFMDRPLTTTEGENLIIDDEIVVPGELIPEDTNIVRFGMLDFEDMTVQDVVEMLFQSVGNLTGTAFLVLGEAFNIFLNSVLLAVMVLYLLADGRRFIQWIINWIPPGHREDAQKLAEELGIIWRNYLRGQFVLSLSVGALTFGAALLLGLPNALILALLAAVFEFVPNIGPLLALIPAAILALIFPSSTISVLEGPVFVLVVILVWGLIQNIESYILHPRIMGGRLNLHPYVVIVAVIIGASLAGPLGIILAAPGVATIYLFLRYIYAKIRDQNPFPENQYKLPSLADSPYVQAVRWSGRQLIRWRRPE